MTFNAEIFSSVNPRMPIMMLQDYLEVKVFKHAGLLYTRLCKPVSHDMYKEAMLYVASILKEHHSLYWLIDATRTNFTMQDQRWSVETLGPLINETSLKKVAMVRDNDLFLEVAADSMRSKIYTKFGDTRRLEHFSTVPEALDWLVPGVPASTLQFTSEDGM